MSGLRGHRAVGESTDTVEAVPSRSLRAEASRQSKSTSMDEVEGQSMAETQV